MEAVVCSATSAMYMLKAREKMERLEREEVEERAMDRQMDSIGGLRIVRGAVSTEVPEDGPPGVKRKVKVSVKGTRACGTVLITMGRQTSNNNGRLLF